MSNNSTNKVDPIIKCYFVSLCTCMALPVLFSFSLTVIVLSFLSAALMIIPLNTLFIYVISRIRLFRWSLYGAQNEAYMSRSAEKLVRGLCFNELGVSG